MTKARDLADYIATGVSDTELDILDGLTTTTAELNYNDTGASVGTVVASKTVTVDANKDASSFRNITMAGDLSIGGDVVTTSNATLDLAPNGTGTVVVRGNDNSGAVVFNCENNSHGQKVYGQPHSASVTNTLMLPAGANSTLVSLVSTDTLTNKTLTSPKVNEDVAVTSTATELNLLDGVTATTAELNILDGVTATAAEINLIDGGTSRGTTAVADGDGFLTNDGGTMRMTSVDTLATYMQNKIIGGTSIVTTGALDSGSITSGFGTINNGSSAITTTGAITGGSFVIGSADINENDLESIDGITAGTVAASKAAVVDANKDVTGFRNVTLTGELDAATLDISGDADIDGTTNLDVVDIDGAVDMASTLQVDGAITSSAGATITTADNLDQLTLKSTDADANSGPSLVLSRDSGSPADNDAGGKISFQFDDDGGGVSRTAAIFTTLVDASAGSEDGKIHIETMIAGAEGERFGIGPTEVVVNEASVDLDFRVEGNGDANLLFVDASTDRVGIGKSGPSELLDVDGTLNTTNFKVGGAQGSDGQVLTSTGSGVAWEDAAGGATAVIASTTLGSAASSITVTGFSTTYDFYLLKYELVTVSGFNRWVMQVTNDSGTAYTDSDHYVNSDRNFGSASSEVDNDGVTTFNDSDTSAHVIDERDTEGASGNGVYGSGFMWIQNPKRTNAFFTAQHYGSIRPNAGYSNNTFVFADKDKDIGGVKFTLADGANFASGSYVVITGFNKS